MFRHEPYGSYTHSNRQHMPFVIPTDDVIPVSRMALLQALHYLQSEQQRSPHSDLRPSIQILQRLLSSKCNSAA